MAAEISSPFTIGASQAASSIAVEQPLSAGSPVSLSSSVSVAPLSVPVKLPAISFPVRVPAESMTTVPELAKYRLSLTSSPSPKLVTTLTQTPQSCGLASSPSMENSPAASCESAKAP